MNLRNNTCKLIVVAVAVWCGLTTTLVQAQPSAIDNDINRLGGHWRVVEMIENGQAIPEDQMRQWLPGGGVLEIVDYTVVFQSPIDGTKSTKTFRLEPTSYPKKIVIMQRDQVTGSGIYKFDQDRLVLCISKQASQIPNQFSAPAGSGRDLIVMERFDPGRSSVPGLNAPFPARKPVQMQTAQAQQSATVQAQPASSTVPAAQPTPAPVVADRVAAQVLTDTQVKNMAVGTWRINDSEGSIDIVFEANGRFQTYRYTRALSNFHVIFVPTPVSSGNWSISNGRLIANVTSSTRIDRVNQSFVPAVRSISGTDMILVDHLGRVDRAVKLR